MTSSTAATVAARRAPQRIWVPRQHGAWAMLLLPLLLGVAASRPSPWQVLLGGAAIAAYLASATVQAWSRARRPPAYRRPILVYGSLGAVLGVVLVVAFPALLTSLIVIVPATAIVLGGARPGTKRDLANSLAQVAQALVLVPAAALVSGDVDISVVAAYTVVAAAYLVGSVLVVRSVLRERGNERFAALSVGFHAVVLALAILLAPPAYAVVAAGMLARAIALPVMQVRRAGGPSPLRPIHAGLVEMAASLAVLVVSFAVPLVG